MRFERSPTGTIIGESYDPSRDLEELPPVVTPEKTPEQMEMLMDRVSKSSFMTEIDEKRMIEALKRFKPKEIKSGETLFKQGEDANIGYIVEEGKLRAFKRKRDNNDVNDKGDEFRTYSPDEPCIDEGALLWIDERPCTVIAETDAKLWEIERIIYTKVVVRLAWERRKLYMMFLGNVRLLDQVENSEKVRLIDAICSKKFAKGAVIMKEGDEPDGIYFVQEGEVELTMKSGEKKTLLRADCFGELALLTTKLREETCEAKTDCEIAFLSTYYFELLMGRLHVLIKRSPGQFEKICKEFLGTENPDDDILR